MAKLARLSDILRRNEFDLIRILGGESGLDREVRSVTVHDAPYSVNWLRGQEMVLSTGFHIRSGSMSVEEWLNILAEKQIACLALAEDFTRENGECLRKWADRHAIPILVVPATKRWSDLLEPVGTLLAMEHSVDEARTQAIQETLHQVLTGEDPDRIGLADGSWPAARVAGVLWFSRRIEVGELRRFGTRLRLALADGKGFCSWEERKIAFFFLTGVDAPSDEADLLSWLKLQLGTQTSDLQIGWYRSQAPEGEPFPQAVGKAATALRLGIRFGDGRGKIHAYHSLLALDLLRRTFLHPLADAELQSLDREIDRLLGAEDGQALFQTLKTYLECNMNRRECARKLFLHPNTVRYRLKKLEAETGLQLSDPYQSLLLQVLFLRHMFRAEAQ